MDNKFLELEKDLIKFCDMFEVLSDTIQYCVMEHKNVDHLETLIKVMRKKLNKMRIILDE